MCIVLTECLAVMLLNSPWTMTLYKELRASCETVTHSTLKSGYPTYACTLLGQVGLCSLKCPYGQVRRLLMNHPHRLNNFLPSIPCHLHNLVYQLDWSYIVQVTTTVLLLSQLNESCCKTLKYCYTLILERLSSSENITSSRCGIIMILQVTSS